MNHSARLLLLQLADGTFPSGGFTHSAGLEATSVLAGPMTASALGSFLDASLRQTGRAALPYVRAAAQGATELADLDDAYDATLALVGPNYASRAQGRALASAASRIWDAAESIMTYAKSGPAHHAPVFGAIFGTLGVGVADTLAAYVHGVARAILSAGVRLGLLGPLEAQRLLADRAELLAECVERSADVAPSDAAQTSPLLEIFGALHPRLDGRMFQS